MSKKSNGYNAPMGRRQYSSLEGVQPPASLLPEILDKLGLSNAPPEGPMSQQMAVLDKANAPEQARVQALRALEAFGAQVPLERVTASLKDKHEIVRIAAIRTLAELSKERPVPTEYFISAWKDPHGEVRAAVLEAMATLKMAALTELLLAAFKDKDKIVRIAAMRAAGTLGRYAPIHELVDALLSDSEWQVREIAALTLGQLGKSMVVPVKHLVKGLYDPSEFVRKASAFALGDRIPIDILIHDLRYAETSLREQTARILGELEGQAQLQPLIEAALTDRQSSVRKAALLALGQQGRHVAAKHLIQAAQDSDSDVREVALLVLAELYPEAASRLSPETADTQTQELLLTPTSETTTEKDLLSPSPEVEERRYISSERGRRREVNYVGQQIGSYKLTRLIGDGGLAAVYLGEHVYLKTTAAIKVLKIHVQQKDLNTFLTEAQTIAQLKHPHIVRVFDFGVEHETPFLVMDYAASGTVRQLYAQGQQVPLPTIVSYVQQVASALQFAHDRGMVHRDVKPENMLLADNGEVLLSDFGIAIQASHNPHATYRHTVSGTLSYMAPEQLLGNPCAASDQYSLGIIVYEWLCGKRPFEGSFTALVEKHLSKQPPSIRAEYPWLSRDVERVVLKALAKDPQDRYSCVEEFAIALEQAAFQSSEVHTAPARNTVQSSTWSELVTFFDQLIHRIFRRS